MLDYNRGNPDGILDPGEKPRQAPRPARRDLPEGRHALLRQPAVRPRRAVGVESQKTAANEFARFVTEANNQRRVLKFGFRPGNPAVAIGKPITAKNGLDPNQPQTTLEVPKPPVLAGVIDQWNQVRKKARVLLVIDVSGSMGDEGDPQHRRHEARPRQEGRDRRAGPVQPEDDVGLRIFSTDISNERADRLQGPRADRADRRRTGPRSRATSSARPDPGHAAVHGDARLVRRRWSTSSTPRGSTRSCCSPTGATRTTATGPHGAAEVPARRRTRASRRSRCGSSRSRTATTPTRPRSSASPKPPTRPSTAPSTRRRS